MTDKEKINQFVNDVYLTKFNRFIENIDSEDGVVEVAKVSRWASMFLDELEMERDYDGRIINWNFARENDVELGTIATLTNTFTFPATNYRKPVVEENRPLTIVHDGIVVSRFDIVDPGQITRRADTFNGDRVTLLNGTLIFSRPFRDTELSGKVVADLIKPIPRLTPTDAAMIDMVPYYELLVLGVAKNATLPGIVEGGLSPSLAQKYSDLLEGAKADNENSSVGDEMQREDFGYIAGVW